jgi:hypothetical protein
MPSARIIAITGAALTIGALLIQYWLQFKTMDAASPLDVTWRYFGYFTILTNWLVVAVWIGSALKLRAPLNGPIVEGMTLTSIAMVGIIYHTLLASRWHPEGAQWLADFIVHTITPALFAIYWLVRPHGGLKWWNALVFALWPLAYCIYALARGALDGWYAYFFLDPNTTPVPQLALNILVQGLGFMAAGLVVIAADKALAARLNRSPQPNASPSAP